MYHVLKSLLKATIHQATFRQFIAYNGCRWIAWHLLPEVDPWSTYLLKRIIINLFVIQNYTTICHNYLKMAICEWQRYSSFNTFVL